MTTLPKMVKDLTGKVFGRLTAIEYVGRSIHRRAVWKCVCQCGKEINVGSGQLLSGNTNSCGCLHRDIVTTHGESGGGTLPRSSEYQVWLGMIARCSNPNIPDWNHYGKCGITVCERWLSYENFLSDMGPRPSLEYSLDRYPDQNGNYEPGNCRWATKSEQGRNKSTNRLLTLQGETHCVTEWAEIVGINPVTIFARLSAGWDVEKILTTPARTRKPKSDICQ